MNKKKVGYILIAFGVVLGVAVGILVFMQVQEAERLRQAVPSRTVVTAAVDIAERQEIAPHMLTLARIPDEAIPVGAADQIDERIVGKISLTRIRKGEVVLVDELVSPEFKGAPDPRSAPSYSLEDGKVAFTFPVRLSGGTPAQDNLNLLFVNAVRPGDRVDILFSAVEVPIGISEEDEAKFRSDPESLRVRWLVQNLTVLQVGEFAPPGAVQQGTAAAGERYLTFLATPEEAMVLKWIKDIVALGTGNVDFILRSPGDNRQYDLPPVDLNVIRERFMGLSPEELALIQEAREKEIELARLRKQIEELQLMNDLRARQQGTTNP